MQEQVEVWKPIPGCEGRYEASNLGRVRSRIRGVRVLRAAPVSTGYLAVNLLVNGRQKTRRVHHLVLETFVGPRPKGMECCHGNDIRTDNRLRNLRWDTHVSNMADRQKYFLTPDDIRAILTDTRPYRFIAKDFGVGYQLIKDIKRGRRYADWPECMGPHLLKPRPRVDAKRMVPCSVLAKAHTALARLAATSDDTEIAEAKSELGHYIDQIAADVPVAVEAE